MCGDGGGGGEGGENVCVPAYEEAGSYIGAAQGGGPNYGDYFCGAGDPGDWP